MPMLRAALAVAGLVSLAQPRGQAQGVDTLSAAQRAGAALTRLGSNMFVRVRAGGAGRLTGWVVSSSANLLTLRTSSSSDASVIRIPGAAVDSLWIARGGHARAGALVGGAVAGIGLGAALTVAWSGTRGPCDGGCGAAPFFGGLIVGGGVGALVGALVGSGVTKWQRWVP
jgi:hypothetical protein